ncbi:dual specificity protein phosphatase 13-like [Synchiropus splendidus]|uniref:dual specificity protein phosphatase 13-like n=1 Tax=Synchiropus splendidus TaxID=270530 RepID=UPI00237D3A21|nr:dual specificity protein phosphatase 13-like [Synchiropus splendidus]XP_053722025.1 dual specificity protein phosphatase 13-like [Synchiropus splendidus]
MDCSTGDASVTPVKDLVKVLYGGRRFGRHVDEVWPDLFLGDMSIANDRYSLWKLGITHVVNAAHGRMFCLGSHDFYGSAVDYYGVPADDSPSFDLSPYFLPSAEYIQRALDTAGARVLVHCAVGVSRSASLVLAYLMIQHHFTLLEAIMKVKQHRWIFPNKGFLKQLVTLDLKLHEAQNIPAKSI